MKGGRGQSGAVTQSPDGPPPFSAGGKTPFQSFLGMAQQHASHNGVSRGRGRAGAAGQGWAGTVLGTKPGPGAHPGPRAADSQPHQSHSHFPG